MRVLIVGGGPAGLTLAIALSRRGQHAELVELNPEWTVLGTGLSLGGAPLRALREVGLAERCVSAGFGSTTLTIGNAHGEVENVLDRPRLNGPDLPAAVGILRPVLHRLLAEEAVRSGVRIRLGVTLTELIQRPETAEVTLSDASRSTYDLVVGADGLRSAVREIVMPDAPRPRFTGQAVWRAMLRRPPNVSGPAMYYGPRNKAGLTPVSEDEMYMFLVQNVADVRRPPRERLAGLLRAQLSDYRGLIGELREQIVDSERVDYRPLHALLLSPPGIADVSCSQATRYTPRRRTSPRERDSRSKTASCWPSCSGRRARSRMRSLSSWPVATSGVARSSRAGCSSVSGRSDRPIRRPIQSGSRSALGRSSPSRSDQ